MFLFQENKSYGIKKTFALILCLHAAVHHVANTSLFGILRHIFAPFFHSSPPKLRNSEFRSRNTVEFCETSLCGIPQQILAPFSSLLSPKQRNSEIYAWNIAKFCETCLLEFSDRYLPICFPISQAEKFRIPYLKCREMS
jgi:hypothetical protein